MDRHEYCNVDNGKASDNGSFVSLLMVVNDISDGCSQKKYGRSTVNIKRCERCCMTPWFNILSSNPSFSHDPSIQRATSLSYSYSRLTQSDTRISSRPPLYSLDQASLQVYSGFRQHWLLVMRENQIAMRCVDDGNNGGNWQHHNDPIYLLWKSQMMWPSKEFGVIWLKDLWGFVAYQNAAFATWKHLWTFWIGQPQAKHNISQWASYWQPFLWHSIPPDPNQHPLD